jgi:hypothetical protein
MNLRHITRELPWRLIALLGLLGLVRPFIKIGGDVFGYGVAPAVTLLITLAIATVWVTVVVKRKVAQPVMVLALTGMVYAVLSIVAAAMIQLFLPDLDKDDVNLVLLLTVGLWATVIFNFIYGAFLGWIATGIAKALRES